MGLYPINNELLRVIGTWLLMTLMSTASCKSKKRVIARALMIGPADHLPIMLYSGEKYMTIDEVNVFWVLQIQFDSHCKVIEGVDDGRNRLFANNALLREEVGGNSTWFLMTLMSLFWYRIQEEVCS